MDMILPSPARYFANRLDDESLERIVLDEINSGRENVVDFHTHTTASDGEFNPLDLMVLAFGSGISYLALTDHDTLHGFSSVIPEVEEEAKFLRPFLNRTYAGVEMTTDWRGSEVHVLAIGYQGGGKDKVEDFKEALEETRRRKSRARLEDVDRINDKWRNKSLDSGIEYNPIRKERVLEIARESSPKGIDQPYLGSRFIAEALAENHLGMSKEGAFQTFINTLDSKTRWQPPRLEEMVERAQELNMITILAHPGRYSIEESKSRPTSRSYNWSVSQTEKIGSKEFAMDDLRAMIEITGGVEPLYRQHTVEENEHFLEMAKDLNALVSVGSDCHGRNGKVELGFQEPNTGKYVTADDSRIQSLMRRLEDEGKDLANYRLKSRTHARA